jgi:rhodanese-related sulfurtransferase
MTTAVSTYEDIDPAELRRRVSERDAAVIDVREPWEFERGHVPGATLIPMGEIPRRIDEIPDGAVLVCASGNRSGYACAWLAEQGKEGLANLAGGTQGWILHGFDVA